MLLTRVLAGLAVLATTAVITTGCFDDVYDLFEPCHSRDAYLLEGPTSGEVDVHVDGEYTLASIDGNPISSAGYVIPGRKDGKKLLGGRLYFNSTNTEYSGDCNKLVRSSGSVLVYYQTTTNGVTKEDVYRGGTFRRDHEANTASMGAFGYEAPLTVAPATAKPTSITLAAFIGEFGIGVTYTLKFTR